MLQIPKFSSLLCHQEVLCVLCTKKYILCGVGSFLYIYNTNGKLVSRTKIFSRDKIYKIKKHPSNPDVLFLAGGRFFTKWLWQSQDKLQKLNESQCSDWILDIQPITQNRLVIISAHNVAQLWSLEPLQVLSTCMPEVGPCILYSAIIYGGLDDLFILAGTVFSEVLVWKADFSSDQPMKILERIQGHKGVIFSIGVKTIGDGQWMVCTTSDDRSIRLTTWDKKGKLSQGQPLYGHTARVWSSLMMEKQLFTIGEDSSVACWNYDGSLVNKFALHSGSGIYSIATSFGKVVTGGGDGGVFTISTDLFKSAETCVPILDVPGLPRKLLALGKNGIACLTDSCLIYRKKSNDTFVTIHHSTIKSGTDFKASSCERYLSVSTKTGQIFLIDTQTLKNVVYQVTNEHRCQTLFWDNLHLLVQISTCDLVLLEADTELNINKISSFTIPFTQERASTCFLRLDKQIILGDRFGNLHLYSDQQQKPIFTLRRVHSYLGVADLKYYPESETLLSVGAGGAAKETLILPYKLQPGRSFSVPIESVMKIIPHPQGLLMAGFHGSHLQIWDFNNKMVIAEHKCGGGHRSFDFHVEDDKITFVYIKNKQILQAHFHVSLGKSIRSGYHSKVINTMQATPAGLIVSGSEDNTIIIAELQEHDISVLHTLEHHISAVRSLKVHPVSDENYLIISCGGREQLSISSLNTKTGFSREITTYVAPNTVAEQLTDSRFMCLDIFQREPNYLLIFVGCSDCTLRIFSFEGDMVTFRTKAQHSNYCILQVIAIENYVVTFATDGNAVFWKHEQLLSEETALPFHSIPLHQSGINCAHVSRSKDEMIIITGGDDNLLCITAVHSETLHILRQNQYESLHSCQITGLAVFNDYLLSTSIDQRVILHSLDGCQAQKKAEVVVTVPDVHGLAVLSLTQSQVKICVYGRGIEVIQLSF